MPKITGPAAIAAALDAIDLDTMEKESMDIVKSKKKTARPDAIRRLNLLEGFRRTGVHPRDLMLTRVPVIPAKFRPFNVMGDTFVPGDANELYRDLIDIRDSHGFLEKELGPEGAAHNHLNIYDAVSAVYGYGDPVKAKTKERGVSGFLSAVTGVSPKFSMTQRRLISKPVDFVGKGVMSLDPELSLDQIGIPENMAWKLYAPYVQRRLVRAGNSPTDAVQMIQKRHELAAKHLQLEMKDRPVMYSRAPAWHKFNVIGAYPKIVKGDSVYINSLVGTGIAGDHDGDVVNVHLPGLPEAVDDVKNRLMPSKMLFSIKDPEKVMPVPKHEVVLGLHSAKNSPPKNKWRFKTEGEALAAIDSGKVALSDEVEVG